MIYKQFHFRCSGQQKMSRALGLAVQVLRKQICEGDRTELVHVFKGLQSCLVLFKI